MQDRMAKVEVREPVKFFNRWTEKLMHKTPTDILNELGIRCYTGSRDVPKDSEKAIGFLTAAAQNATTKKEAQSVTYYDLMVRKFALNQQLQKDAYRQNPEKLNREVLELNTQLHNLATDGHPLALFSYAKDLYAVVRNGQIEQEMNQVKNTSAKDVKKEEMKYFKHSKDYFEKAAAKGVNSAYFYLGMIYLDGKYEKVDHEKALDYYIKGAAKNNAYCFFELSRLHASGIPEIA